MDNTEEKVLEILRRQNSNKSLENCFDVTSKFSWFCNNCRYEFSNSNDFYVFDLGSKVLCELQKKLYDAITEILSDESLKESLETVLNRDRQTFDNNFIANYKNFNGLVYPDPFIAQRLYELLTENKKSNKADFDGE